VVICSEREGLPRVAVQAAIASVPIVTTALPGIETIVVDGETGYIAPVNDLGGMEDAIIRLIDDRATSVRLRSRLAARDFSAWSAESMMTKIGHAYATISAKGA
jgi:glycosyltransferase involved in cell wall biosynthesis